MDDNAKQAIRAIGDLTELGDLMALEFLVSGGRPGLVLIVGLQAGLSIQRYDSEEGDRLRQAFESSLGVLLGEPAEKFEVHFRKIIEELKERRDAQT